VAKVLIMSQFTTAVFEDGVLKPDGDLDLAPGTKVQIVVTPVTEADTDPADPLDELDRLCAEHPVDSGGLRLTRDQLHERR
jgi:predicted DNA-binding antitoxin AbrB/MazE fold protein